MKHKRVKSQPGLASKETSPGFNVVIAYDDRNSARRAMNVVTGLVREFGNDFRFRCDLWRFDVLGLPKVSRAAARAGDAADLLIVAASGDKNLPGPVRNWLEWCADGKPPGSAALVALLESQQRSSDVQGRTRQFLHSAAVRGCMDFFLHEVDLPEARPQPAPTALEPGARGASSLFQRVLRGGKPLPGSWTRETPQPDL